MQAYKIIFLKLVLLGRNQFCVILLSTECNKTPLMFNQQLVWAVSVAVKQQAIAWPNDDQTCVAIWQNGPQWVKGVCFQRYDNVAKQWAIPCKLCSYIPTIGLHMHLSFAISWDNIEFVHLSHDFKCILLKRTQVSCGLYIQIQLLFHALMYGKIRLCCALNCTLSV